MLLLPSLHRSVFRERFNPLFPSSISHIQRSNLVLRSLVFRPELFAFWPVFCALVVVCIVAGVAATRSVVVRTGKKNLVLLQLAAKTLAIDVVRGKCDHLLQNGRVESTVTNEASPQGNKGLRETR